MRFRSLTVRDVGVFRGTHTLDFMHGKSGAGSGRNVTLVVGHNGAGKSTLFQAMSLAMYGSLALGDRTTREEYSEYLARRLRKTGDGKAALETVCPGVSIELEYVRSGKQLTLQVQRDWRRVGSDVRETLQVLLDGSPPEVEPTELQSWLSEFFPPAWSSLLFFDAERIAELSNPQRHGKVLQEICHRLLGLDIVDRLDSDLAHFVIRRGAERAIRQLREQALQHERNLKELEERQRSLLEQAGALKNARNELTAELARQERRLSAEGGGYAERRPLLLHRLDELQSEADALTAKLRELTAGLLPFSLAPDLCLALSRTLASEAEVKRLAVEREALQRRITEVRAAVEDEDWWHSMGLQPSAARMIAERLLSVLLANDMPAGSLPVPRHSLADPEREKLQAWISHALHDDPVETKAAAVRLRAVRAECRSIVADLNRVPSESVLAPIHAEVMRIKGLMVANESERRGLDKLTGAVQFQAEEESRLLEEVQRQLSEERRGERDRELAEGSRSVLRAYRKQLVERGVNELAQEITTAFCRMSRKQDLISTVRIDPVDFGVTMAGAEGEGLRLDDLSAGERQMYAYSVLWALREVSKHQLPLAIDTPLARLDELHRERLVSGLFSGASGQILLFVTGTELASGVGDLLKARLAGSYWLSYDGRSRETAIIDRNVVAWEQAGTDTLPASGGGHAA